MKTQILKDKEGNVSIITKKGEKTFEFKQFKQEISIACLLMEHSTSFDFSAHSFKKIDAIHCRAALPRACLKISTIETEVEDRYKGSEPSLEDLSNRLEKNDREKNISGTEEKYHNLLRENQNIKVSISPAEDINNVHASLFYHPWGIYALQGIDDFFHEAHMTLEIPSEIYNDIKTKILNGPPIHKFMITAEPEIIKSISDKPEDIAEINALFCEKHNENYSLLFNTEVGIQKFKINSIFYDCDPVEIKKPSTIASFGSWKGTNLADTINEKISAELHELRDITQKDIGKLLEEIREILNKKRRWWF